ncbi:MAG: HAD family phosphatase [Thermoleophilaceae bacterium]|nr:HAD family phosphatase [Thermoleophilaceae bacterium]
MSPAAVVFDLDGVLVDSESLWDDVRRELTIERGGEWKAEAQQRMMGMSSIEWSAYMRDDLRVPGTASEISDAVVARMEERYRERLPVIDGAPEVVRAIGERWPLAIASSANRPLIDLFLTESGLAALFCVAVSSEEVARGKPAPDVYLRAAELLELDPASCAAVEDSSNGLRAAAAAGFAVVAIPNREFPPAADALEGADLVIGSIRELTPRLIASL